MHISVCIITYKRPAWLERLIRALLTLRTDNIFTYSVVVVDNDPAEGARDTAAKFAQGNSIPVRYYTENQSNLAQARNTAIRNATGDHIAFLDDDEFPVENWLLDMVRTLQDYDAAGVLGPVVPYFEADAPQWIIRSKIYDRPRYPTGRTLTWNETRTGNVLLRRDALPSEEDLFDTRFAKQGEDIDFFRRLMNKGHRFVWCDTAIAYESHAPHRLKPSYHLRLGLVRGSMAFKHAPRKASAVFISIIAFVIYAVALPFLLLRGFHFFMKFLIKLCDHSGRIAGAIGIQSEKIIKLR